MTRKKFIIMLLVLSIVIGGYLMVSGLQKRDENIKTDYLSIFGGLFLILFGIIGVGIPMS